jgi:di/tricarboxylate transporter
LEFTLEMAVVVVITGAAVVLFVKELLPADMVALLVVCGILLSGVTSPKIALSGFSNPAVHTIAAMFVISAALVKTGVVETFGRYLIRLGGDNPVFILLLTLVSVVFLSAFINNTPIVMMMIPLTFSLNRTHDIVPSKFLIPVSYASIFGGCCTLIGTSTNLVVSGMGVNAGLAPLGMFEMAPVGLVLAAVGIVYLVTIGRRLLPERETVASHGSGERSRQYVTELVIHGASPLVGQAIGAPAFGSRDRVRLLQVIRDETILWPPFSGAFRARDMVILKGEAGDMLALSQLAGVELIPQLDSEKPRVDAHTHTLAELVVTPGSPFEGSTVKEIGFHRHFHVTFIALERHGRHREGKKIDDTPLRVGDVILVQGEAKAINRMRGEEGVILLEGVERTVKRRHRAPLAVLISLAVVLTATLSPIPIVACAIAGALLMVLTRCLSIRELYQGIDVHTLVLIAGMIGLGYAAIETGTAAWTAHHVLSVIHPLGPLGVLAAIYLLTNITTEFLSNVASAVLMVPLAISTAQEMGLSERPFIIAVAFAASAAFSTPVGYQTNTIVYGPGGYRFVDYVKVGLPLNLLFFLMAMFLIPAHWPF